MTSRTTSRRTSRMLVSSVALVLAVGALAGCSGDDPETEAADRADTAALTLCRTVAVAQASLNGTRSQLSRGNTDQQLATSYDAAVELVSAPASDPAVPADLAALTVELVKTLDQSRALITQLAATGIITERLAQAAVREFRAGQAVLEACAEAVPGSVPEASPSEDQTE